MNIFYRGIKGGIRSINTPIYDVSLYELLKTYASIKMLKDFQTINIPKLPVFTAEEGIKLIRENFNKLDDWIDLNELIPNYFLKKGKIKKTGLAGIFAASLELTKEGSIEILQKNFFEKVMIKRIKS